MCLGIPMRIVEKERDKGIVEAGGVKREVSLHLVEGVEVGDYVIVHAGFAIQKLDEKEAEETLRLLKEMLEAGEG